MDETSLKRLRSNVSTNNVQACADDQRPCPAGHDLPATERLGDTEVSLDRPPIEDMLNGSSRAAVSWTSPSRAPADGPRKTQLLPGQEVQQFVASNTKTLMSNLQQVVIGLKDNGNLNAAALVTTAINALFEANNIEAANQAACIPILHVAEQAPAQFLNQVGRFTRAGASLAGYLDKLKDKQFATQTMLRRLQLLLEMKLTTTADITTLDLAMQQFAQSQVLALRAEQLWQSAGQTKDYQRLLEESRAFAQMHVALIDRLANRHRPRIKAAVAVHGDAAIMVASQGSTPELGIRQVHARQVPEPA